MEAYQQRVVDELVDLVNRAGKLSLFIQRNDVFAKLPADEQERLRRQLGVMDQYAEILKDRIEHFPKDVAAA